MTVPTSTAKSGPYAGAGTTGPFTVGFRFLENSHLQVIRTSTLGLDSTLTLTTDYSVTGAGGASGTLTLVAALASGEKLTIIRNVPFTQDADYVQNDAFPAESHERALDKLTMEVQQVAEEAGRALTLPATVSGVSTTLPTPQANSVLAWNPAANELQNLTTAELATIVAYGTAVPEIFTGTGSQTLFVLSSNPGALGNLDVAIGGVTQLPGIDYTWSSGTTVTFTTAPVLGAKVLIRYMQALALGTADAGSVQYTPAGTGAVATTVQAKLRESVSVFDFMTAAQIADVKAATLTLDVTAAIQAAIDSAKSIFIPPGTYKITGSITLTQNIFQITGVKGKSILMGSGGVSIFGYFKVATQYTADFGLIENLTFDSDDSTKTRWAIYSPSSVYVAHWKIAECNFNGRLTGGIIANLIACHIYRCYFGVYYTGSGNDLKAIQSFGQVAPNVATSNINIIEQCEFSGCGSPSAIVEFETGYKLVFRDCIFEQLAPDSAVVLLSGIQYPVFEGCWFENAQGTTGAGKSVIWTRKDANNIFCEVLTVENCLFQTYATIPDGLINFSDSIRKVAHFAKNLMVSLQSTIIVGGNNVATFVDSFGNSATIGVGGDATGLQYDSPAKFDLGVAPSVVVTPAILFPATQVISTNPNTLDDYEEGSFTPTDASGSGLTLALALGTYTKVGRLVSFVETILYPTTADGAAAIISKPSFEIVNEIAVNVGTNAGVALQGIVTSVGISIYANGTFTSVTNASLSGKVLYLSGTYMTTT